MDRKSRRVFSAAASLGVWVCAVLWGQRLFYPSLCPPQVRAVGKLVGMSCLCFLSSSCLIILQKQSRRAGSISAPVEVCSGVYPAKLFSPLPCYPSPIASPCHVWGLGFCIFVNKLKIHSGIQILLNDVWVAS